MRPYLWLLFLILFLLIPAQARGAEPQLESLQNNMIQLQQLVRTLQSSVSDLKMTVENQNEVIHRQSIQIEGLQKGQPASGVPVAPPPGARANAGVNPDIGVVGTVQTKLTQNKSDEEGNNAIALKELELNFGGAVDPYSRFDSTLAFNDHMEEHVVHVEEAYYTRWGLPLGFTGQIGKFRADIGKQNLLHAHALPTADYPLVIQNFFGEEGLSSSGLRLKNNIPNPWNQPIEISGEILRGNNGPSFDEVSRNPIFNTHLKTFFEPTADTNLELGWTTMFGAVNPPLDIDLEDGTTTTWTRPEGTDWYGVKVFGADATMNWFLPEGKQVKWQNEIYFQQRPVLANSSNGTPWGFYSLLDYRFSPKFTIGARVDYVDPLDVAGGRGTNSVSPYLIFWQSEYADVKLQYSHTVFSGGEKPDNAGYVVVDFLAGSHKHAIQ